MTKADHCELQPFVGLILFCPPIAPQVSTLSELQVPPVRRHVCDGHDMLSAACHADRLTMSGAVTMRSVVSAVRTAMCGRRSAHRAAVASLAAAGKRLPGALSGRALLAHRVGALRGAAVTCTSSVEDIMEVELKVGRRALPEHAWPQFQQLGWPSSDHPPALGAGGGHGVRRVQLSCGGGTPEAARREEGAAAAARALLASLRQP